MTTTTNEVSKLRKQNKILKEALKYYANCCYGHDGEPRLQSGELDLGATAATALDKIEGMARVL